MDTTQKGRILKITTPLGEDNLLIEKLTAEEGISRLFSFEVELLHAEEQAGYKATVADIQSLLGQSVSIVIEQQDKVPTTRRFCGIVSEFMQGPRDTRFSYYKAKIVPHVWILTQVHQSRIFQHKSVPDILKDALSGFNVSYELEGTYQARNYCVQYNESDFDFISRLMEEEGIFYYFEHTADNHKMVIADSPKTHQLCPSKSEIPYFEKLEDEDFVTGINKFNVNYRLQTGKVAFRDYNFQLTTNTLESQQPSRYSIGNNKKLERYSYPGGYARKYDDIDSGGGERSDTANVFPDKDKTAEIAMQALDASVKTTSGTGDCSSMTAGYRFKLKNNPNSELNKQYVITSIRHTVEQSPSYVSDMETEEPYGNEFECLLHGESDAPPFRPQRKTAKPLVHGSQTAIVVGLAGEEIFTDKYGRVKVQFHWDREGQFNSDSSCWLWVATSVAGNKWGTMYIPRIGQEVMVDFLEGDPDKPIIVGSVYNPQTMPHYDLPKYKTLSYIKTRTSKDDGKGFNELRFEDKQGKEQVFIHSQKRMDTRVRGSFYETCGGNRQEVIGVRSDNQPGGNLAVTVGGNYDLHIKADNFIGIDGKLNEGIKGDVVESYNSNQQTVVKTKVEINAKEITLEGSQKVTLKVGSSFIVVDMMGITIVGPMIKINSGGAASPTGPASLDDPLDAETADTGEPGYLDKPRSGGGHGRTHHTLDGQHAPDVVRNGDGSYNVGKNIRVEGTEDFTGKALKDISELYNTPTGRKVVDNLNSGTHTTTIKTLDEATARRNGGLATRTNPAGSVTPGTGSDTIIQYNPDVPDGGYTDEKGNPVTLPNSAMLGHEMIHAIHNDQGNNLRDNPEPSEPDSNEEESQTIGIHGHKDDELTHNNILKDLGDKHRRTDHDTSVVTVP